MKQKNICKFISTSGDGSLRATQFILENTPPDNKKEVISHSDRVLLVLSGEGKYTVLGKTYPLSCGTLIFTFSGQSCVISYEKELSYMYIKYYGNRASMLYERFSVSRSRFYFTGMEKLIPIWRESLVSANGENIDLLSESIILYTFSKLSRSLSKEDGIMRTVTEYIGDNFSDSSLSLQSMAEELGYSSKYLSNVISKEMGVCFSDYVKDLRMKHAMMLLEQGITSIKNLAVLSGYSNPLYFSKVFKETFGVSPKGFTKRNEE